MSRRGSSNPDRSLSSSRVNVPGTPGFVDFDQAGVTGGAWRDMKRSHSAPALWELM